MHGSFTSFLFLSLILKSSTVAFTIILFFFIVEILWEADDLLPEKDIFSIFTPDKKKEKLRNIKLGLVALLTKPK